MDNVHLFNSSADRAVRAITNPGGCAEVLPFDKISPRQKTVGRIQRRVAKKAAIGLSGREKATRAVKQADAASRPVATRSGPVPANPESLAARQASMMAVLRDSGPFAIERIVEEFSPYMTPNDAVTCLETLLERGLVIEEDDGFKVPSVVRAPAPGKSAAPRRGRPRHDERESTVESKAPTMRPGRMTLPPCNLDRRHFLVTCNPDMGPVIRPETRRFVEAIGSGTVTGRIPRIAERAGMDYRSTLKALVELCAHGHVEDLDSGAEERSQSWKGICESVMAALAPGERVPLHVVADRLPGLEFRQVKGGVLHGVFNGAVVQSKHGSGSLFGLPGARTGYRSVGNFGAARHALSGKILEVFEMIEKRPMTAPELFLDLGVSRQRADQLLKRLYDLRLIDKYLVGHRPYVYSLAGMTLESVEAAVIAHKDTEWPGDLPGKVRAALRQREPIAIKTISMRESADIGVVTAFVENEAKAGRLVSRGGAFAPADMADELGIFCFALDPRNRGFLSKVASLGSFKFADLSGFSAFKVRHFVSQAELEGLVVRRPGRREFSGGLVYDVTETGQRAAGYVVRAEASADEVFYRCSRGQSVRARSRSSVPRLITVAGRPAAVLAACRRLGSASTRQVDAEARKIMDDVPKSFSIIVGAYLKLLVKIGYLQRSGKRGSYVYSVAKPGVDFLEANGVA